MGAIKEMFALDVVFNDIVEEEIEMSNIVEIGDYVNYGIELIGEKKENEMSYVEKLVNRVAANNKSGVVINAVGITASGEIKVIRTSRNAGAYKLMKKNELVEVYLNGVHHVLGENIFSPEWRTEATESLSEICEAGDYMCQLENFGVREDRALTLRDDLYNRRIA